METDPAAIAKIAAEKEDENWRFRSFLKGCDLDGEELDAIVRRHYADVAGRIDCCACGNCCRELSPILHTSDVSRLARGLHLPETQVVSRFLAAGEQEHTFIFNQKPCPLFSGNRCTVYLSRPDDCRSYPHLQKDGFLSRLMQAVENCSICPIVFHVWERLKDELWHRPDDVGDEESE